MLPATYQVPAAIILVVGGLLACFAGYRLFRVVLGIYGFILGALLASSIMSPGDPWPLLVAAVVGGLIGAVLLNLAYFVGVALLGAGAGALLVHLVSAQLGRGDPHVAVVVIFAVVGAIAATQLQRYVIVFATAFGGAWTMLVGTLALLGDKTARVAAAANNVWVVYPLSPGPGRAWIVAAWIGLSLAGLFFQLRSGPARPVRTKKIKRR
jgi:hypothetical protein